MQTKAVRLYGKNDLRLEEFTLPAIKNDEILAEVITDSLCMSTYKAVNQGAAHSKVPDDVHNHPIIVGHEFCGRILSVGEKWSNEFTPGDKFVIQPNIGDSRCYAPGYSFPLVGGDATKVIMQNQIMKNGSLLHYHGNTFFEGSLVEPLSCVVGAFNANYHLEKMYSHKHVMGIKEGGNTIILGGTGPMGFLAIDLALHGKKKPKNLVVTGRTQEKLDWAKKLYTQDEAKAAGINLYYVNTKNADDLSLAINKVIKNVAAFDDVFVFVPNETLVQQAETLLAYDGCLNFFAGPIDHGFSPKFNFYDVHYKAIHTVGTSGSNTDDMKEAIKLIETQKIHAAKIVTHIMGLNAASETTLQLAKLDGGKKLVYTHKNFPLTQISTLSANNTKINQKLSQIVQKNNGLWNAEAEQYFIEHAPSI